MFMEDKGSYLTFLIEEEKDGNSDSLCAIGSSVFEVGHG